MNREEKGKVVEEVRESLERSKVAVVLHYRGLTVDQMNGLRVKFREAGVEYRVVKNTLARLAAKETPFEPLADILSGPTSIALSEDPVAPAKVAAEFAKTSPHLQVVGGVLNGAVIDAQEIAALAKLPAKEVLVAKMLGSMMSPLQGFVGVLHAVPAGLVRVLEQVRVQKEGQQAA